MNRTHRMLALMLIAASTACSRGSNKPADTGLNSDLSLAAQQSKTLDSVSALERADSLTNSVARPGYRTTARTRSTSGSTRRTSSSSGTVYSSGGTVVKHTQRDAAIGAVAG